MSAPPEADSLHERTLRVRHAVPPSSRPVSASPRSFRAQLGVGLGYFVAAIAILKFPTDVLKTVEKLPDFVLEVVVALARIGAPPVVVTPSNGGRWLIFCVLLLAVIGGAAIRRSIGRAHARHSVELERVRDGLRNDIERIRTEVTEEVHARFAPYTANAAALYRAVTERADPIRIESIVRTITIEENFDVRTEELIVLSSTPTTTCYALGIEGRGDLANIRTAPRLTLVRPGADPGQQVLLVAAEDGDRLKRFLALIVPPLPPNAAALTLRWVCTWPGAATELDDTRQQAPYPCDLMYRVAPRQEAAYPVPRVETRVNVAAIARRIQVRVEYEFSSAMCTLVPPEDGNHQVEQNVYKFDFVDVRRGAQIMLRVVPVNTGPP